MNHILTKFESILVKVTIDQPKDMANHFMKYSPVMFDACNDTWDTSRVIGVSFSLIIIIV